MIGNPRMEAEGAMKKEQGEMERELAKQQKQAEGAAQQMRGDVQDASGRNISGTTNQAVGGAKQAWNRS